MNIENLSDDEGKYFVDTGIAYLAHKHRAGEALTNPEETKRFLQLRLMEKRNEIFGCVFLDNRHRVLGFEDLFFGTVDGASVYPRVVVQKALQCNAAAVVFYHNHPSGVSEPSTADRNITKRLVDALATVDIRVIDHLVIGSDHVTSFAERGLL